MDAHLAFWTWAWVNMVLSIGLALLGIVRIRQGAAQGHRRLLFFACLLVALFLVAYLGKVFVLGREQLELWSAAHVTVLRIHELCVLLMLLPGAYAVYLSLHLGLPDPPVPPPEAQLRRHRQAGWVSVGFGVLAVLTAAYVLLGMYERVGGA